MNAVTQTSLMERLWNYFLPSSKTSGMEPFQKAQSGAGGRPVSVNILVQGPLVAPGPGACLSSHRPWLGDSEHKV
ncbi:unnamed protein product [Lota lota]